LFIGKIDFPINTTLFLQGKTLSSIRNTSPLIAETILLIGKIVSTISNALFLQGKTL
jgi:hypothetical protein